MTAKQRRVYLERENRNWPEELTEVPRDLWPEKPHSAFDLPVRVMRSRRFLLQVFEDCGRVRLSVCRTEMQRDGEWKDSISWDDLYRLKAEAGFADELAVEIYPAARDLVNVANMRHLWIVREGLLSFGWTRTAHTRQSDAPTC